MQKFDVTTAIIVNNKEQLLLIKRVRQPFEGKWALVSGIGASKKGLIRENAVKCEVNYDLGVPFSGKLLFILPVENDNFTENIQVYLGKVPIDEIKLNPDAGNEYNWFSLVEIENMKSLAFQHKEIIERYKSTLPF